MRDDAPVKRCYVKKPPTYDHPMCRHWLRGISEKGCGTEMWQKVLSNPKEEEQKQ